jgi:protein involved in polysaccharide export with SLBB domain
MKLSSERTPRVSIGLLNRWLPIFLLLCFTVGSARAQTGATSFGGSSGYGTAPSNGTTAPGATTDQSSGNSSNAVSSAISSGAVSAAASAVASNPDAAAAAARRLGIPADQALTLLGQIQSGSLTPSQMQTLVQRLCSANLSPGDLNSIAGSLGLNGQLLGQIQQAMSLCHTGLASMPGASSPTTPTQGAISVAGGTCPPGTVPQSYVPSASPSAPGANYPGSTYPGSTYPGSTPGTIPGAVSGTTTGTTSGQTFAGGVPGATGYPSTSGTTGAFGTPSQMTPAPPTGAAPSGTSQVICVPAPAPNGQPYVTGTPSSIEAQFQQLDNPTNQVATTPSPATLAQFGYSVFSSQVSTFAPVQNAPVTDDYILGPGDGLIVMIWGRINETLNLTVQRDGTIVMDQIGPISVAGLTFGQAKKLIENRGKAINGAQVYVTMGQIRTIQVFVVGEVANPGAYQVSALSHVSNVLEAAGGITKVGSLRRVELRRQNQTVGVLDLYNLLLHGDDAKDQRVQDGDVIFVPVVGSVVGVAGDVKRPAIYELASKSQDLRDVLKLAGGVGAFSYTERLQIERVQQHQRMVVLDLPLNKVQTQRFRIQDGDLIKVYPVLPDRMNTVTLAGNVRRPGEFQWYKGMRVSDLIRRGQGFLPHTYFNYALLKRLEGKQKYQHFLQVDLSKAMSESLDGNDQDTVLQPHDELDVYSEDMIRDLPSVWIAGNVRLPGQYPLSQDMKLEDLVYLAGGFTDNADRTKVEIARTQVVNGTTRHTYMDVDLAGASGDAAEQDVPLKNNDQIFVRQAPDWHLPWVVTVSGQVLRPGLYTIHSDTRLATILERCGGFLPDAFPAGLVFTRASVRALEQQRLDIARQQLSQELVQFSLSAPLLASASGSSSGTSTAAMGSTYATLQSLLTSTQTAQATGRIVVHFKQLSALAKSPENLVLQDGDSIDIPRKPQSVAILGQVYNPTSIVARPDLTVRDYLYKAGGITSYGDPDNVLVIKADGSMITEDSIRHGGKASIFPMLPLISGGLMNQRLAAGDTVYVPQSIQNLQDIVKMQYHKDISTIVSNAATSLALMALLFTKI